jgi:ATP-binding cassette subfamily B (MDR/TAP) protein 1
VFFAKSIMALSLPPPLYGELRSQANFWSWMYFMLAMVQLISFLAQGTAFAYCSERLVHRARDKSFRYMLRQDIEFFDREENTAGALTSFLSTETNHLAGMSGTTLGTILLVTTTLVACCVIALAVGWKLALVCIATVPILLGCGFFRFWMLARFQTTAKKAYEKSASYACEATSAIRTVASLTREDDVWQHYHDQLVDQGAKSLHSVIWSSTLYAASQSLSFLCMALGFWYGGTLISSGEYNGFQFFLVFTAVIFGSQSAGTIFSFAPDMGKAKHAAAELKILMDRKPKIDTWSNEGKVLETMEGSIEFRDVHFRYPTRPEQPVLRGLNLTVKPGQYVALVGASGCGKSTTIAMLERFYDPLVGGVYVDGHEISSLNVNNYRSHLALVSQEPTLYQGTIRDNILLGADTKPEDVPEEAIVRACKDANIYEFILSLPDAFNTVVGNKGSMLSGGQKQRIAIARALLRNPKVLLLDEATSALDSESEKVVQAALDLAAKGRTTIAVAHRLSTIQKADMIFVFDQGRVVENGTHNELLAQRGRYFELVNLQSLGKQQ